LKQVFKTIQWFIEHDDDINITPLLAPGGGIFCWGPGRQIVLLRHWVALVMYYPSALVVQKN